MVDDASSRISSSEKINSTLENSDSNIMINYAIQSNKGSRTILQDHFNDVLCAKFKGVVPLQNGNWGAQIYANHQRIWLGTFKTEKEAAMAYDSAAIKLRSGETHRNFPWTKLTLQEPYFQNHYNMEVILEMIKDGSYPSKFVEFLRTQSYSKEIGTSLNQIRVHSGSGVEDGNFLCKQLFQKELTPSDVGKLNRLVIPKKYAVKYFPQTCENDEKNVVDDIELVFFDKLMKSWKFRYCYWKSSQSFVFTRGWNRFVKEKCLKANDIITFYTCECGDNKDHQNGQTFCLIDVVHIIGDGSKKDLNEDGVDSYEKLLQLELKHKWEENCSYKFDPTEPTTYKKAKICNNEEDKEVRLFGVRIDGQ